MDWGSIWFGFWNSMGSYTRKCFPKHSDKDRIFGKPNPDFLCSISKLSDNKMESNVEMLSDVQIIEDQSKKSRVKNPQNHTSVKIKIQQQQQKNRGRRWSIYGGCRKLPNVCNWSNAIQPKITEKIAAQNYTKYCRIHISSEQMQQNLGWLILNLQEWKQLISKFQILPF